MRSMKDGLGRAAIERLAANLARAHRAFDTKKFTRDATRGLEDKELKERVMHVIGALAQHLPESFQDTSRILVRAAEGWDSGAPGDSLAGFAAWPVIDYVGVHGLSEFELGLQTLRRLTPLFTAEFAMRAFLTKDPETTLATVKSWLTDPNPAVRRLCSEGLRPRLPWGKRVTFLEKHPERLVKVLDRLVYDASDSVRRSVANHLNDLSKTRPELVVSTAKRWLERAPQPAAHATERLVRHAIRSLIKAGHPAALALVGAAERAQVRVEQFRVAPRRLELGGALELTARLRSTSRRGQTLIVDFVIHHQKHTGATKPKVFKWKALNLAAGDELELKKRHSIRAITTRKYYAGVHRVELLVNGKVTGAGSFTLCL